jgi:DNA polymerase
MAEIAAKDALRELAAEIIRDNVCPDLREQATQLVIGDGNPNADIVFIGEAPGKQEDEKGLPFVGASGKFLNEMLAAAGLKREDVYITNIVKYRPPNNRDPLPEEKREFWPYLMRQLEIIQPKVVITLGRHSGSAFIPDLVISKDHGHARTVKYHDYEFLVIPLYHPAAALYNGSMRQVLIDDFITAKAVADTALIFTEK